MSPFRFLPLIAAIATVGAGCWFPTPNALTHASIPKQNVPANGAPAIPCLSFDHRDGFAAWIDAYDTGAADAVRLATQIKLPEQADKKWISDVRASFATGATPSFVCALSDDGASVAWVMEPLTPNAECRDTFYVSLNGLGTSSDVTATGRTSDCRRLCAPKRFEAEQIVWQCDVREQDGNKTWSQMHMNRKTGAVEIVKCQKDELGMPSGCVE